MTSVGGATILIFDRYYYLVTKEQSGRGRRRDVLPNCMIDQSSDNLGKKRHVLFGHSILRRLCRFNSDNLYTWQFCARKQFNILATFWEKKRERNLFEYLGALWVRLPTIGGDGGRWTDAEDVSFEADLHWMRIERTTSTAWTDWSIYLDDRY